MKFILLRPEHPGNIGAVARVLANFGFTELILVNPGCEWLCEESRKRSKHGLSILTNAKIVSTLKEAGCDWLGATSGIIGSDDSMARIPISSKEISQRIPSSKHIGFVFGPESSGLLKEEVETCDAFIHIPASTDYPILNLSQAVGIIAYEASKSEITGFTPVPQHEKNILLELMDSLIDQLAFETAEKVSLQKVLWRRVFGKAMLSRREAFGVINVLKKILHSRQASGEHGKRDHQTNKHGDDEDE